MDQSQPQNRVRRRQDPVSCQLCRTKKLKCDRQCPCSNCSARGVVCQRATRQADKPNREGKQTLPADNPGILSRLEKLENAVFGSSDRPLQAISSSQLPCSPEIIPDDGTNTVNEEHRTASKWLEGVATREDSIFPVRSGGIPLTVQPITQLLADPGDIQDGPVFLETIKLPTKSEASSLLRCYLDKVHSLHPVVHPDSVQNIMDKVYRHPHIYNNCSHIALLLSIFASVSHFWGPQSNGSLVFGSVEDASFMASVWSKAALDLLVYSRRTTPGSIEDVQAAIIVSFFVYNVRGFSTIFRSLHSAMITMARDLSLHKIDSPRRGKPECYSDINFKEDETRRRIWWHIASLDWLLAFSPGPQQGTYLVHPSHMRVNYPQEPESRDGVPSSISFFLQVIQLSEICRTVVDTIPCIFEDTELSNYEQIITLDTRFEDFINSLPPFFSLEWKDDDNTDPQIATQRYLIHLGTHTRRSKLHQPFLVRGFTEPKYAYSRMACLRSARTILEVCRIFQEKQGNVAYIPARLGAVVHHVFTAAVVLVMDLCFNKVNGDEEQRQEEVMRACRMLDELKRDSPMAAKFLGPLMEILQKYKVRLLEQDPLSSTSLPAQHGSFRPATAANPHTYNTIDQPATLDTRTAATSDDWDFDQMMQNYIDLGQNANVPVWDDLFAEVDSYNTLGSGSNDFFFG
ncbi:hypothetical protein PHISCL_03113 [Aspergillus sclerotialis]|uniref:Zn(2)-C6 fungal-type domain-containing protein n=1 Tax=Aspergillus sclerotialis TaxID=2070753 RepID=A0A3A2ZNB9_9EURO|nr:hypothetical protein PHISCL_03113 [Aspergillus sclerotialis]